MTGRLYTAAACARETAVSIHLASGDVAGPGIGAVVRAAVHAPVGRAAATRRNRPGAVVAVACRCQCPCPSGCHCRHSTFPENRPPPVSSHVSVSFAYKVPNQMKSSPTQIAAPEGRAVTANGNAGGRMPVVEVSTKLPQKSWTGLLSADCRSRAKLPASWGIVVRAKRVCRPGIAG